MKDPYYGGFNVYTDKILLRIYCTKVHIITPIPKTPICAAKLNEQRGVGLLSTVKYGNL